MLKKGFTLIEILLVVGIAAAIFALSAPYSLRFYETQLVEEARSNLIDAIQKAKHNAILQKSDSSFGVSLGDPNGYTLFQGETYDFREPSLDEVYTWANGITINLDSFGNGEEIVFSKLAGTPNATGTIAIFYNNLARCILVSDTGNISKTEIDCGVDGGVVEPPAGDSTAPTVTAFTIPTTASSLTVDITFTATDTVGVTGYKITESATAPLSGDAGWTVSAPATYTFDSAGSKTLYAWAKDAAGNVSSGASDTVTITLPSPFMVATGGNLVTEVGNYRIHKFTSSGTFTVTDLGNGLMDVLVVAGGGAGGYVNTTGNTYAGAGGGAGGYVNTTGNTYAGAGGGAGGMITATDHAILATGNITVTVGAGGAGVVNSMNNGANSVFDTLTAIGGGAGARNSATPSYPAQNGNNGGSGGGSSNNGTPGVGSQGGSGGRGSVTYGSAGSGGGAGAPGVADASIKGANGGAGLSSAISGVLTYYAGGGGSGGYPGSGDSSGGEGGLGGGGHGGAANGAVGSPGSANTGGGGGGAGGQGLGTYSAAGGSGGSGVVIIRYLYQ